ncbi:MAG: TlpA disulfide reductase family protein, partial [Acidobacteriota bacterium]
MRFIVKLLVAVSLLGLTACRVDSNPDIQVGQPIPDFELPSLAGNVVASSSLHGKPVVLNFWATWCGPCVKEIPTLKTLAR